MGRTPRRTSAPARRWTWAAGPSTSSAGAREARRSCSMRASTTATSSGSGSSPRSPGRRAPAPTTGPASATATLRPSEPAVVPAEQVVDELHELLANAEVDGPYVLVGHSLGGLNARLYAARHPDDLAGIVFVDPTSPNYFEDGSAGPEALGAAISYRTAFATTRSVELGDRPVIVLGQRTAASDLRGRGRPTRETLVEGDALADGDRPQHSPRAPEARRRGNEPRRRIREVRFFAATLPRHAAREARR